MQSSLINQLDVILATVEDVTPDTKKDFVNLIGSVFDNLGKPSLQSVAQAQFSALKVKYADQPEVYRLVKDAALQVFEAIIAEVKTRSEAKQ